ncbi:MAG: hypothetical protein JW789_01940 [Candidatus Aenigmarchaeota archaeon]|nr:hypothetical protein [Candidatus Aenigmarchaeota archaeon]
MKMKIPNIMALAALSVFTALLLPVYADANLVCDIRDTTVNPCNGAGEIVVFRMYDTDNSHAALYSDTDYNYAVCCSGVAGLGRTCTGETDSAPVIILTGTTNSHVENPAAPSPDPDYDTEVCLSTGGGLIWCTYESGSCSVAPVCMASVSADTNAHIGDCDAYTRKVCCFAGVSPRVTSITYNSTRGDILFEAAVIDDDGDPLQQVEFNITYGSGSTYIDLGTLTAEPWEVVWRSTDVIANRNETIVRISARAFDGSSWGDWTTTTLPYIDNILPDAVFTSPANDTVTGRIFNITWTGNVHADEFDVQYVDSGSFRDSLENWQTASLSEADDDYYTVNLEGEGDGAEFCFRIRARDITHTEIIDDWSCNPAWGTDPTPYCMCTTVDTYEPVTTIMLPIENISSNVFPVIWTGSDAGGTNNAGIQCHQVQYRIDNIGSVITQEQAWTQWSDLSNIYTDEVLVYNPSSGECELEKCVDFTSVNFDQDDSDNGVAAALRDEDNHTFFFRARAIDNAYGCANIKNVYTQFVNGTWIDWTDPPSVSIEAKDPDEAVIVNGQILFISVPVNFSIIADPNNNDYTGVNETGIVYTTMAVGSNYAVGSPVQMRCPGTSNRCWFQINPWTDDYNISYIGFAADRAGNRIETGTGYFTILKPLKLTTDINRLYMTLGSYKVLTLTVSNRQTEEDTIKVMIDGYSYARFVDASEGVMAQDNRSINITLSPKETRTLHVHVYTSDIGDNYKFTVYANSTTPGMEQKISDFVDILVKIEFPASFYGLTWPAIMALMAIAAFIYFRHGKR